MELSPKSENPTNEGRPCLRSAFLWQDTAFFGERIEKAVGALAAAHRRLEQTRPLGGAEEEFLRLYDFALTIPDEIFSRAWLEPACYAWSVTIYDRVGLLEMLRLRSNVLEGGEHAQLAEEIERQLVEQLNFFKALLLPVALEAGRELRFESPLALPLPFTLPGTDLTIMGSHEAEVLGLTGDGRLAWRQFNTSGELDLKAVPSQGEEIGVSRRPVVTAGGCHIRLDPFAARLPHYDFPEGHYAAAAPQAIGPEERAALESAIGLYAEHLPEGFPQFREWTRVISSKSPWARGVGSVTTTELPGLITMMLPASPLWLAETLVHEYFHHRLFFIDEERPIMEEIPGPAIYYSPWRDDARPPHGIMHATYVFTPVTRFFARLQESAVFSGPEGAYVTDFVLRTALRLHMGLETLREIGGFTPEGEAFFLELTEEIEDLLEQVRALNLSLDEPAYEFSKQLNLFRPQCDRRSGEPMTIRQALLEHIELAEAGEHAKRWLPFLTQRDPLDSSGRLKKKSA